ncbi:aspartate/glutamate racemase family protein [Paenibacillus hamazuiensis]|uniref:aspartate/glutamate racemase family protein n=1 Tax=Paenibacillus hamazuiensis TaxID=2936508 RepID=UPI00200D7F0C|nr:aspartate/glutamate racemase family protein [Paenibacillus hamazuiensis]
MAVNEQGGITPELMKRLTDLIRKAVDTKADGILLSCSSFSPLIPEIQKQFSIPVLSVDGAMLDLAVKQGRRIGVIATVAAAGPATRMLLEKAAEELGKPLQIFVDVVPEAFEALKSGDTLKHDQLIKESAEKLLHDVDLIVLAQISMARTAVVLEGGGVSVLTSPQISAHSIMNEIEHRHK